MARLVSTGRSNREVAAELYVSIKAVEFHLGHVYDKIGIRSRRDLAGRMAAAGAESGAADKHQGPIPGVPLATARSGPATIDT